MKLLTEDAVDTFLKICQREIKKGKCYFVGDRKIKSKNHYVSAKQALLDLGIMRKEEIWNYVLQLTKKDCIKVDFDYDLKRDFNSEMYIFKKEIHSKIAYIKLTMRPSGIICLSFHEDSKKGGCKR